MSKLRPCPHAEPRIYCNGRCAECMEDEIERLRAELVALRLDNKVEGGRICLVCHGFWPDTEVLCPGCLEAMTQQR